MGGDAESRGGIVAGWCRLSGTAGITVMGGVRRMIYC